VLRRAHLYLAQADRPAILPAMHYNAAGIYYEQEDPLLLPEWRDRPGLAAALHSSLGRFSMRDQNLRDRQKTEWPSYVASHCRSVREFETAFLCIGVGATNEAELFYDASIQPHGELDISLHVTLNRHGPDEEIERQLVRLFDVASGWDVSAR
jgi:hypothetical protein